MFLGINKFEIVNNIFSYLKLTRVLSISKLKIIQRFKFISRYFGNNIATAKYFTEHCLNKRLKVLTVIIQH